MRTGKKDIDPVLGVVTVMMMGVFSNDSSILQDIGVFGFFIWGIYQINLLKYALADVPIIIRSLPQRFVAALKS